MQEQNNITLDEIETAAYNLGLLVGTAFKGFNTGITESLLSRIAAEVENEPPPPPLCKRDKKRIELLHISQPPEKMECDNEDCTFCWCNTCDNINDCKLHKVNLHGSASDKITMPLPCIECVDGEAFQPRLWIENEKRPGCGNYTERE